MNTDFDTLNLTNGVQPGFSPLQTRPLFPAGVSAPLSLQQQAMLRLLLGRVPANSPPYAQPAASGTRSGAAPPAGTPSAPPAMIPRQQVVRNPNGAANQPFVNFGNAPDGYAPGDPGAQTLLSYGLGNSRPDDSLQEPLGFAPAPMPRYQVMPNPDAPARLRYGRWDNQLQDWRRDRFGFAQAFSTRAEADMPKEATTGQAAGPQAPLRFFQDYDEIVDPMQANFLFGGIPIDWTVASGHGAAASPTKSTQQSAAALHPDATNGWGETYWRAVHDRNLYSKELARFRQKYPGHPDDPVLVAHIRMYNGQIERMNKISPTGKLRTNIAAARRAPAAPPAWQGTLEAFPGAILPGFGQGFHDVGHAVAQAGTGFKQFVGGIVNGGANAFAIPGDEFMGQLTGNGGYYRASQKHAAAINPNYADPNSYVPGWSPGYMADIVQSAAQNPSTRGLASIFGAGSGGWSDQLASAAGLYAGGDRKGSGKVVKAIPGSEWNYIASNSAQFGVNTLMLALSMRGGMLAKADSLEDAARTLSKTGKPANAAQATQLMGQAARLRDAAGVRVPRGAQGAVDSATRAIEKSQVARQTAAAMYALDHFGNPFKAMADASKGTMPWGAGRGPVIFRPREDATPDQIEQYRAYVKGANAARRAGRLSPTGRVSTTGQLRRLADKAVDAERARAAGTRYFGDVGHVPDTMWTGTPEPFSWLDMDPTVNKSLGGQGVHYEVGYRPTEFRFLEPGTPWAGRPQPLTLPNPIPVFGLGSIAGQMPRDSRPTK